MVKSKVSINYQILSLESSPNIINTSVARAQSFRSNIPVLSLNHMVYKLKETCYIFNDSNKDKCCLIASYSFSQKCISLLFASNIELDWLSLHLVGGVKIMLAQLFEFHVLRGQLKNLGRLHWKKKQSENYNGNHNATF